MLTRPAARRALLAIVLAATSSGVLAHENFQLSCKDNWTVSYNTFLVDACCADGGGKWVKSQLDISDCLTNQLGTLLIWTGGDGNAGDTCGACRIQDRAWLECDCADADGGGQRTAVELVSLPREFSLEWPVIAACLAVRGALGFSFMTNPFLTLGRQNSSATSGVRYSVKAARGRKLARDVTSSKGVRGHVHTGDV